MFNESERFTGKYFSIDNSNIIFLFVLSIIFLAVSIYNKPYMNMEEAPVKRKRHYTYMLLIFVQAMTGVIISNNLGLSWVLVEATTLASAYLIYFTKTKTSIEAAWKYVFICSIGIALAFVGIILLTISTGELSSLNFYDLILNANTFNKFWLKLSFVFILFGFGTKMGLAPVHFWLPDAHSEAPAPASALLSATLLNSAFYVILKVFNILVIANCASYARLVMYIMGFLSLFVAAVFIYHINNYKRMLAYSSIENMGILIIGTALGGLGIFAAIIHLIGHSLIKASFFLTSGNILKIYGTKKIKKITNIITTDKRTGWLWILCLLGITAFPPSVLFISEFLIIKSMFLKEHYILALIFVLLLTIILFGLAKAVFGMCYGENQKDKTSNTIKLPITMYIPQILLLITAFILGLYIPWNLTELVQLTIFGM
ncbi:TPA: hydrogenase [Candidatus Avigastranaerophilus faecigallinarum]|nr:hydrogenase [Candidatus Avigastranaerophilus faecigallinarum]